jgi:hypothetical protein
VQLVALVVLFKEEHQFAQQVACAESVEAVFRTQVPPRWGAGRRDRRRAKSCHLSTKLSERTALIPEFPAE